MPTIGFIGLGLALLLAAIYTGVQASMPGASPVSRDDERWLSLGIAAILALLLTRVIIGARVAFFAPFLRRSIETAVGMWVAIAIVAVGLSLVVRVGTGVAHGRAQRARRTDRDASSFLERRSRTDQFVEDSNVVERARAGGSHAARAPVARTCNARRRRERSRCRRRRSARMDLSGMGCRLCRILFRDL